MDWLLGATFVKITFCFLKAASYSAGTSAWSLAGLGRELPRKTQPYLDQIGPHTGRDFRKAAFCSSLFWTEWPPADGAGVCAQRLGLSH